MLATTRLIVGKQVGSVTLKLFQQTDVKCGVTVNEQDEERKETLLYEWRAAVSSDSQVSCNSALEDRTLGQLLTEA